MAPARVSYAMSNTTGPEQRFVTSVTIAAPVADVFAFHTDVGNLPRISPPGIRFDILAVPEAIQPGARVLLRMIQFGLMRLTVEVEYDEVQPPHVIAEHQTRGPFRTWSHRRLFQSQGGATVMTDVVQYSVPFGAFGRLLDRLVIGPRLRAMFAHRHQRTRALLEGEAGG